MVDQYRNCRSEVSSRTFMYAAVLPPLFLTTRHILQVLLCVFIQLHISGFIQVYDISYYAAHSSSFALCLYLAAYIGFLFSFSGNCSVYALSEFYVKVIWDISCKLTILPYNYFRKPEMVCGVWKLLVEKERLLLRGAGDIRLCTNNSDCSTTVSNSPTFNSKGGFCFNQDKFSSEFR